MGVPLEEMDAVFGEGTAKMNFPFSSSLTRPPDPDELQEFYENQDSEQASLVGSAHSRRSATRRLPNPPLLQVAQEWFSSIVGKRRDRSAYEPIRGDE